jgi:hypothetical protein
MRELFRLQITASIPGDVPMEMIADDFEANAAKQVEQRLMDCWPLVTWRVDVGEPLQEIVVDRICENCRNWRQPEGEVMGQCHAHAPLTLRAWPLTDPDDFCGEWAQ